MFLIGTWNIFYSMLVDCRLFKKKKQKLLNVFELCIKRLPWSPTANCWCQLFELFCLIVSHSKIFVFAFSTPCLNNGHTVTACAYYWCVEISVIVSRTFLNLHLLTGWLSKQKSWERKSFPSLNRTIVCSIVFVVLFLYNKRNM